MQFVTLQYTKAQHYLKHGMSSPWIFLLLASIFTVTTQHGLVFCEYWLKGTSQLKIEANHSLLPIFLGITYKIGILEYYFYYLVVFTRPLAIKSVI